MLLHLWWFITLRCTWMLFDWILQDRFKFLNCRFAFLLLTSCHIYPCLTRFFFNLIFVLFFKLFISIPIQERDNCKDKVLFVLKSLGYHFLECLLGLIRVSRIDIVHRYVLQESLILDTELLRKNWIFVWLAIKFPLAQSNLPVRHLLILWHSHVYWVTFANFLLISWLLIQIQA